jgi:hypothetical protein
VYLPKWVRKGYYIFPKSSGFSKGCKISDRIEFSVVLKVFRKTEKGRGFSGKIPPCLLPRVAAA